MGAYRYTIGTSGRPGGVDDPAVRAAGSMGDWNQARDGAIGTHRDAGGQCGDAIEAGVHADGRACILHMGMKSGALGRRKAKGVCLRNARMNE